MLTPHSGEYLEAIYRLGGQDRDVNLSALAEHLGFSAVSVNEMVRRLEEQGLVSYTPYRGVCLTEEGLCQALALLRRHRLWERFLTDVLGLPWDVVHEEACQLEHVASEKVTERLDELLQHPDRCPHGKPMPGEDCRSGVARDAQPLSALRMGQQGEVAYIGREDAELLRYLEGLGLHLNACVAVEEVAPFQGPIKVRVDGVPQIVGYNVASTVFVATGGE
jgi:DtxR family Mn-dependent transcriptional regulator